MSQAGGPSGGRDQIAAASVAVTGNIDPLLADLKRAEGAVNASAQKMGAAAKVSIGGTGSTLFPGVNLPGAGGAAGSDAKIKETSAALGGMTEKLRESGLAATRFLQTFTRIGTVVGLVTGAIGGLAYAFANWITSADRARARADDFRKSMDATFDSFTKPRPGIAGTMDQIANAAAKLADEERKKRDKGEMSKVEYRRRIGMIEIQEEAAKQRAIAEDAAETNLESSKKIEDARVAKLEESLKRRQNLRELEVKQSEDVTASAEARADARRAAQEERLANLGKGAREAADKSDPTGAVDRQIEEQARAMVEAAARAQNPIERMMIVAFGNAIIKGLEKEKANIAASLQNAFLDAINGALQTSGGTGESALVNMVTSLRDLQTTARAIQSSIPRTEAGAY